MSAPTNHPVETYVVDVKYINTWNSIHKTHFVMITLY